MKPQNQKPNNFSRNPLEQGGRGGGFRAPEGRSFEPAPRSGAAGKKRNPRWTSVAKTRLRRTEGVEGWRADRPHDLAEKLCDAIAPLSHIADIRRQTNTRKSSAPSLIPPLFLR